MAGRAERDVEKRRELERQLQNKSLLLANLEVMIEDYRREKARLLDEVMRLREMLWDLTGGAQESGEDSDTSDC